MSSTSENSALLAILAELQKLNGRISTLESKPSASVSKAAKKERKTKEKDPNAPKREPTAWRIFSDRVRDILRSNGYEKAALGVECVQFCSSLKEESAELDSWTEGDILARRAAWSKPEISKGELKGGKGWAKTGERRAASKAGSVASGGEEADGNSEKPKKARKNPWEGLSEEERAERIAKMKAGKAAKKAASEGSAEEAPESPKAAEAPKAKTEAAPKPKVTEAPKVSAAASASASAAPSGEFKPVMLSGNRYLVNLENGHAYHRLADGGQGEWAGIFSKTMKRADGKIGPGIDDTVPEPGAEAEEEELNFDDE